MWFYDTNEHSSIISKTVNEIHKFEMHCKSNIICGARTGTHLDINTKIFVKYDMHNIFYIKKIHKLKFSFIHLK
jgi:hypothetical protein